jgi:hypothetical protein
MSKKIVLTQSDKNWFADVLSNRSDPMPATQAEVLALIAGYIKAESKGEGVSFPAARDAWLRRYSARLPEWVYSAIAHLDLSEVVITHEFEDRYPL